MPSFSILGVYSSNARDGASCRDRSPCRHTLDLLRASCFSTCKVSSTPDLAKYSSNFFSFPFFFSDFFSKWWAPQCIWCLYRVWINECSDTLLRLHIMDLVVYNCTHISKILHIMDLYSGSHHAEAAAAALTAVYLGPTSVRSKSIPVRFGAARKHRRCVCACANID